MNFIENKIRKNSQKKTKNLYCLKELRLITMIALLISEIKFLQAGCSGKEWKYEMVYPEQKDWTVEVRGGTMATKQHWDVATNWVEGQVSLRTLLPSNKERNRKVRMENGNGFNNNIVKIYHWNAGPMYWNRKRDIIEALTLERQPDILVITEANLMCETSQEESHIQGYDMVLPLTMDTLGYSRVVMLVRQGINFKILDKCMDTGLASIYIQLGIPGRKSLNIGGIYREHHLLRQPNVETGRPNQQLARWNQVLVGWKAAAARNSNCVIIGDLNLDFTLWNEPEYNTAEMINRTKVEIETIGFVQILTEITRSWPDQRDSLVDHIWTNIPENIISHRNELRTGSDHNMISTLVRTKDKLTADHEVLCRSWKNFDIQRAKLKLSEVDWSSLYECENVDIACHKVESELSMVLNREAPMRKRQTLRKFRNWVDESLKEKMRNRDRLREVARLTGDRNDWNSYRRARNQVTKDTRNTKKDFFKKEFEKLANEKDMKNIFKTTRDLCGWSKIAGPKCFLKNGTVNRKPKDLANIQLEFFTNKMVKLQEKLKKKKLEKGGVIPDPLCRLRRELQKWKGRQNVTTFSFKEISVSDTVNLVRGLGKSTIIWSRRN